MPASSFRLAFLLGLSLLVFTSSAALALAAEAPPKTSAADPLDWPSWRGPEQNGVSRETGLPDSLDAQDEKLLSWKNDEAAGISTPIVMRGKLYTIVRSEPNSQREQEAVIALDAATGKKLWKNEFQVFLSDVPAERIGWSCCVGDPTTGRVFVMGVNGYFQCLDGETGKTIWSRSLSEEFGLLSTYGGRTNVPVLFEDLVIASGVITSWDELAVPAHRFLAFNKNTGEVVWFNGTKLRPEDTTYSTPTVAIVDGQALLIFGSSDGALHAFQPRTGKEVWKYQMSRRGLNVSPLVDNEIVYMGQSEENTDNNTMGIIAAISAKGAGDITKTNAIWQHKEVMVGKSSPLLYEGRLYAIDDSAALYIYDAKTGKQVGRKQKLGTIMKASPLGADGKVYITANTTWAVLAPTESGYKKLAQGRFEPSEECQGSPIVSHGRVYVSTTNALYCFEDKSKQHAATAPPAAEEEKPVGDDKQPALVQVTPAEALLKPGDTQKFTVRLFNNRGQFVGESPAEFAIKGGGQIGKDGVLKTDGVKGHSAIFLTAKVGDLEGKARVRVVPTLPWKFDFADKEVPITWVGARHRHIVREVDGNPLMVKVTTIPKGTRSQAWMGPTSFHDYTIQADVKGAIKNNKLPDIGLIAQRYTLDMMGELQQLQIRTWTATLRMAKSVPFQWKPDVWYTMKFKAANENGKAVLRGKVWEKGTTEPGDWMITAEDEIPNTTGSPGLFGNATNAEVFIDNVTVTPNDVQQASASR